MLSNYICGLDIGSSKIAAAVAEISGKRITHIFFDSRPSKGIKKGVIVDSLDLVGSIEQALKNLKAKSGINIKFVYTNFSGENLVTKHSFATIPLAERGNKVITLSDIHKVKEQARVLGSILEEEIIHALPFNYSIDSKNNILNPIGLYSHRLEVDLYLISCRVSYLQSLNRAINQAGYEIKDVYFCGLATAKAVFGEPRLCAQGRVEELNTGINILCDIGNDITEISAYHGGILKDIRILPFGGYNLTAKIQHDLKIPFELAEEVKISYACAGDSNQISKDKEILIKRNNLYAPVKQKQITQIISAEINLICRGIREAIEKLLSGNEINNFIATGRTVLLEGFLEVLENNLGIRVKLGRITNAGVSSLTSQEDCLSGHKFVTYISALGIICQAFSNQYSRLLHAPKSSRNVFFKTINKVKEVYQEYF